MTRELPQGWAYAELQDVCTKIQDGTHFSPQEQSAVGKYKYITAKNIKIWGIDLANVTYVGEEVHRTIFTRCNPEKGDVLYIKDGATTGIATVNNLKEEFSLLSSVALLKPNRNVLDPHFLKWYLNSPVGFKAMTDQMTGSAITRLVLRTIRSSPIPVAPLREQQRIVAKLEVLLGKVDACRKRLQKIPVILKRFRQSVLAAACSGSLTADWREENSKATIDVVKDGSCDQLQNKRDEIPDTWRWAKFGSILASIRGGSTVPPQNDPTDFPILRSSSVRQGSIDFSDIRFVNAEDSKNCDNFVAEGDLLFTRLSGSIEYVANCALARHLSGRRTQYPDRLFCARLSDQRMAGYVELCFGNPVLRAELTEHAKSSAGHQRVSISDITGQVIPLPPIPEQHEIVRRVEALFALADQIETRYAKAKTHVDRLSQSILAKAFRGDLVQQDPDDEPASVLLERIRIQRQGAGAARSQPRRKSVTAAGAVENR